MALSEIQHLDESAQECTDNCFAAAQACEWCADECIKMGSEDMTRCIQLCRDVADLTTLHARLMARDSGYHGQLAEVCAEACAECAEECAKHDHEHCQLCADVLRDCAATCEEMAAG